MERLDLAGMDFIWRIAMESPDEEIANEAIQLIITYSYTNLNPKMKKVGTPCAHAHAEVMPALSGVRSLRILLPSRILCLCTRNSLLIVINDWR